MASEESLFSTVGVFPAVNSINDNAGFLEVKTNTVFSDSESMGSRGKVNQWPGEGEGIAAMDVQLNLFNDSLLQLSGEFFEFSLPAGK